MQDEKLLDTAVDCKADASEQDKQEQIVSMFDAIAPSYDLANRILSLGVDKSWRKRAVSLALSSRRLSKGAHILDVACGTGDMLFYWEKGAKKAQKTVLSLNGLDPSSGMLDIAKTRFPGISFTQGMAQDMPYEDESMDIISIAYGIRNVQDIAKALAEFKRVLRPGGLLVVLEFTKRKSSTVTVLRDWYLRSLLPVIGGMLSNNKEAYKYLPASIDGFLDKEGFEEKLGEASFLMQHYRSFSFGICSLFIARKER